MSRGQSPLIYFYHSHILFLYKTTFFKTLYLIYMPFHVLVTNGFYVLYRHVNMENSRVRSEEEFTHSEEGFTHTSHYEMESNKNIELNE